MKLIVVISDFFTSVHRMAHTDEKVWAFIWDMGITCFCYPRVGIGSNFTSPSNNFSTTHAESYFRFSVLWFNGRLVLFSSSTGDINERLSKDYSKIKWTPEFEP